MKRKLVLSEEQLAEICGWDEGENNTIPSNMYANQTTTTGGMGDKPITTDEYSDWVSKQGHFLTINGYPGYGYSSYGNPAYQGYADRELDDVDDVFPDEHPDGGYPQVVTTIYEGKKKDWETIRLNETNSRLDNRKITAVVGSGPDAEKFTESEGNLAVMKTRAKERGDKEMYDGVSKALNNQRDQIRRTKENSLMPNAFQKPGGTKNHGNGMAHTKKKDGSFVNINYFN